MEAYRHDPALYEPGDEIYLQTQRGWSAWGAKRGEVVRKTPSGQIVAKFGECEIRINAHGDVANSRQHVVSKQTAYRLLAEEAQDLLWLKACNAADAVVHVTRQRDIYVLREAVGKLTAAIDRLAKDPTQ